MAPRGSSEDPKVTALRESRCLNPHPEQVTDPAFLTEEFFDARDAVQVKYERRRGRWHAGYSPGAWSAAGVLAARLGRASGMRVLFPEYRLAGRGSRRTAPASRRAAAGPCHRCCPHPRSSREPGSEPSGPAFTPHR